MEEEIDTFTPAFQSRVVRCFLWVVVFEWSAYRGLHRYIVEYENVSMREYEAV